MPKRWSVLLGAVVVAAAGALACGSGSGGSDYVEPTPPSVSPTPYPLVPLRGGYRCRDGYISQAQHRQGACSHHGGIALPR